MLLSMPDVLRKVISSEMKMHSAADPLQVCPRARRPCWDIQIKPTFTGARTPGIRDVAQILGGEIDLLIPGEA